MNWISHSGLALIATVASAFCSASTADACFFPFMPGAWGGYGAGYGYGGGYGAPAYGGYYAGYSPMWGSPAPMNYGYYSVGYGAAACGCAPVCCNPCASGCATGNCAGGDCAASSCIGTNGDSLKPAADPGFPSKSDAKPGEERTFGSDPATSDPRERYERERVPLDGFSTPGRMGDPAAPAGDDQWDATGRRRAPATDPLGTDTGAGTGAGTAPGAGGLTDDGLFGEDALDRKSNRPPMTDPVAPGSGDAPADVTDPAKDPAKSTPDFLPAVDGPGVGVPQSQPAAPVTDARGESGFGSQLREVIPAARLAGRNLSRPATQYSAKDVGRPIRWISLPAGESHVRL